MPLQQVSLHCRKCGSAGIAVWEDPARETPQLVSLSEGFYQRPLVGAPRPEIICDRCGTGQS
jgi:hypothetical protein